MFKSLSCLFAVMAGLALTNAHARAGTSQVEVTSALTDVKILDRPGRMILATVWDGNKYVQCRRLHDRTLRCEAAGSLMQTSLTHILTAERIARLSALGWKLDPNFGNYVRIFSPKTPPTGVANAILAALSQGYGADLPNLETEITSVADQTCPPRNGPSQNLAGIIDDAPAMASTAVYDCAYSAPDDETAQGLGPNSSAADLIKVYGPRVTAEILRLRVNLHREVFVVFETGLGYVQCQPESEPDAFYCEAQSADSWPALTALLTPERIAQLHAAGYADPGRAPNYSKTYPMDKITDAALARELLTLLHDVYGYSGASALQVKTEEGD